MELVVRSHVECRARVALPAQTQSRANPGLSPRSILLGQVRQSRDVVCDFALRLQLYLFDLQACPGELRDEW